MGKEYQMDVTVKAEAEKAKVFQDVLSMLREKEIPAKEERDANGDVCVMAFALQPEDGDERDIVERFRLISRDWKEATLRIGYEERESGTYGYGVLQDGRVLDSFVEERRERASPLEEKLRSAILESHQTFEEAYRLHEPKEDSRSNESVYLLLGWNSCQRVVSLKVEEIVKEKVPEDSQPEKGYGGFFRKLEPTNATLGREQLERLDEEIALSMLRIGYRPKEIAGVVKRRSPVSQVFIKQRNRESYAKKVLLSVQQELRRLENAR